MEVIMYNTMQTKKKGRPRKQKVVFSFSEIKLRAFTHNRPVMFYCKDIYPLPFLLVTEHTDNDLFMKLKGNRDVVVIRVTSSELEKFKYMYDTCPVELRSNDFNYEHPYLGKHFRFFAKSGRKLTNSLVYTKT